MDILLDTHVILWFFKNDARLSKSAIDAINNPINKKYVSIASIWEAGIKHSLGKLKLTGSFDNFVETIDDNGFLLMEITTEHIKTTMQLPYHHRDPFDRMLIAQSISEGIFLMTDDENVMKYDINPIW